MTALNKQALREELEICSKDRLRRLTLSLLDDLDAAEKRIAEAYAGWGNCQLTMGVYCHAYEEAKTHIAELIHNHRVHAARLIDERIVLKERIAELESRMVTLPYLPDDCDQTEANFKYQAAITAAGIGVKGE